jgi:predicted acyl esterase
VLIRWPDGTCNSVARMKRHLRYVWLAVLVIAVAVAAISVVLTSKDSTPSSSDVASDKVSMIPTAGATLAAEVVTPKKPARPALIVMPGGWGQTATANRAIATMLAQDGYLVVAYAERGFPASTGEVDFGGAGSQHDVSTVIDWALAHTKADPDRIGLFGLSYGAGLSLIGAAHDSRVKAVAALSTWADVAQSYDPQHTPSTEALGTLLTSSKFHLDATTKTLRKTLLDTPKSLGPAIGKISESRSPASYVKELNTNHPAIMLANGFEDSLFPPSQLVPFFDALKTPKRLELAPGDHGGPEAGALYGLANETVHDVEAWFDHYLRGLNTGIETEPPIQLLDVRTGVAHGFKTWPEADRAHRVNLGEPGSDAQTGDSVSATWQASLTAGADSGASSGPLQVLSRTYAPPQVPLDSVKSKNAFVWSGPAQTTALDLNGTPIFHFSLGCTASTASVFIYLYDVTPDGVGTLVDVQPYTATGLSAKTLRPVTVAMQPISWSVPTGDHLTLVIDTADERYESLTPDGARVTIGSSAQYPASFDNPVPG